VRQGTFEFLARLVATQLAGHALEHLRIGLGHLAFRHLCLLRYLLDSPPMPLPAAFDRSSVATAGGGNTRRNLGAVATGLEMVSRCPATFPLNGMSPRLARLGLQMLFSSKVRNSAQP
jgi:hypothetical protein